MSQHGSDDRPPLAEELTAGDREALHEFGLGIERLHRAHGHLVAFHHHIGGGMDHLAAAERMFRDRGFETLANQLRDEYLPRGVITGDDPDDPTSGRWSYDILENFQRTFLGDIVRFGDEVHEKVSDGLWHAFDRGQERDWKYRAR